MPVSSLPPLPTPRASRARATVRHGLRRIAPLGVASLVLAAAGPPRSTAPRPPERVDCPVVLDASTIEPPPAVAREFRAAWISPVDGGEWPSRPGMSDEQQRAELLGTIERAAAVGLNAIVLHVRPASDAMYPTDRAPWSSYLVGANDAPPSYDPLAYALAEAHRRGLQVHVWFNPFRAAPPNSSRAPVGARAIARRHPEWIVRYGSQQWVDPGFPGARREVLDAMLEVVERYDVDGVHLDDYFYPYREERTIRTRVGKGRRRRTVTRTETIRFDDDASWARHGRASGMERDSWRRENVSQFVATLYREVKARKPEVAVGISPFGIWRPGAAPGVYGLDAYAEIYADSRKWLREGWLDYVAPQLYWVLDGEQQRFRRLDAWWRTENVRARHIYPGLLTMRVASRGSPWPTSAITQQVDFLRDARAGTPEAQGHVHFRLATLMPSAPGGLGDQLAGSTYAERALPPASPWLGAAVPAPPQVIPQCEGPSGVTPSGAEAAPVPTALAMTPGDTVGVRWWLVQSRDGGGRWYPRLLPSTQPRIDVPLLLGSDVTAVGISAVSPTGVQSAPTIVRLR